jgi:hypothetical protein
MTIEERYAHWRNVIETQKTSGSHHSGILPRPQHTIFLFLCLALQDQKAAGG